MKYNGQVYDGVYDVAAGILLFPVDLGILVQKFWIIASRNLNTTNVGTFTLLITVIWFLCNILKISMLNFISLVNISDPCCGTGPP